MVLVSLVLVVFLSEATTAAWAVFVDKDSAALTVHTATLQPPTSVAAAPGTCTAGGSDSIVLSWTASATAAVTAYEVLRASASAGPYSPVATVVGRTVQTYTDAPLPFATTYYYVIRSIKERWRSAQTAPVPGTTRSSLCS